MSWRSWPARLIERIPLISRRRLFILYGLALIIGTHTPRVSFGKGFVISTDKLLHIAAFTGLAFFMMSAQVVRGTRSVFDIRNIWWCAFASALWGGITELTQGQFVAGRSANMLDAVCDVIGIAAAVALAYLVRPGATHELASPEAGRNETPGKPAE